MYETHEDYVTKRLIEQMDWYDKKSSWNKKCYQRTQFAEIVLSALIPALVGFVMEHTIIKYAIALLGVAVVVLQGVQALWKYHENWISYRRTAEMLKRELALWETKTYPYESHENEEFQKLVTEVEGIISNEVSCWQDKNKRGK